jgi:hypothetical protein
MIAETAARRFPLVSRVKPPGRPIGERISALGRTLRESDRPDRQARLARASEALNVAALIASDCGMPELARDLCWEHHDIFDAARPLPYPVAKLALQPVLNIARQMIRDGDGTGAHDMLTALLRAARAKTTAHVAGRRVDLADVTLRPEDHKATCTGLWAAVLSDGTRALAQAGRWTDAAQAIAAHHGIGTRLLDGRQVSILSQLELGAPERAIATLEESQLSEPWERTVAAVLRVYCHAAAGSMTRRDLEAATTAALGLAEDPETATVVFRVRVGLTALELDEASHQPRAKGRHGRLRDVIATQAATDAYAAREALASPAFRGAVREADQQCLIAVVEQSGLGIGHIPLPHTAAFDAAIQGARDELTLLIQTHAPMHA